MQPGRNIGPINRRNRTFLAAGFLAPLPFFLLSLSRRLSPSDSLLPAWAASLVMASLLATLLKADSHHLSVQSYRVLTPMPSVSSFFTTARQERAGCARTCAAPRARLRRCAPTLDVLDPSLLIFAQALALFPAHALHEALAEAGVVVGHNAVAGDMACAGEQQMWQIANHGAKCQN